MFELRNHPSQARHPVTNQPLVRQDGTPVPLFPELRAIYMEGVLIGYCGSEPGKPVTLIRRVDEAIAVEIDKFIAESVGAPCKVAMPPLVIHDDEPAEDVVVVQEDE